MSSKTKSITLSPEAIKGLNNIDFKLVDIDLVELKKTLRFKKYALYGGIVLIAGSVLAYIKLKK